MLNTRSQATTYAQRRKRTTARVKEVLVERLDLDRHYEEIPDDCHLFGIGLGLDSIDSLEIVVAIEGEFGIRVEDDQMKMIHSVNSIVDLIIASEHIHPDTTKEDYRRMRTRAGLVDLHTWTRFKITGPDAADAIDAVIGCNVRDLFEGRAAQTLIPSPTGGVDAIVWVLALETSYWIVAEPAERANIAQALNESTHARHAELHDIQDERFALALIGPKAEQVARRAFGDDVHSIAFLNVLPLGNPPVLAARLGHFGEYELHLFGDTATKQAVIDILEQAADEHPLCVGNDALPGMMIEMGTLSRIRDIPHDVSVFEAGLQWMIDFRKDDLRSADALVQAKGTVKRKCVLMTIDGHSADLHDQTVFLEGHDIGRIQCAFDSETIDRTVALAYLTESFALPGLNCTVGPHARAAETVSAPAFLTNSIHHYLS